MDELRDPQIKVKDLASHMGFDDPYYFSRVFKKVSGKSPEIFRKEIL